ncbi:MAG: 30S ribosomal protein S16 [Patescibacteria group bacterium]
MLKIRFQRIGRKNDPAFRVVVTEHARASQAGKNVAVVGNYHPKTKQTMLDGDAIKLWLSRGAQASGSLHNLLITKGIISGKKINVLGKKTPIVKEAPAEEVKAEAPSETQATAEEAPKEEVPAA